MRFQDKCSCNNCGDCKIQALEAKCAFQAEMLERAKAELSPFTEVWIYGNGPRQWLSDLESGPP